VLLLQNEPPLPASLAVLRLSTCCSVGLDELIRGADRLSAAARPVLILDAVVRGSLNNGTDRAQPQDAAHASSWITTLPVGFSAVELHATYIDIRCSVGLQRPTPAAVAQQLLQFFADAPPSYSEFSLCCKNSMRFGLYLNWPLEAMGPDWSGGHYAHVEFDNLQALAGHLRSSATVHNMSIDVVDRPASTDTATLVLHRM